MILQESSINLIALNAHFTSGVYGMSLNFKLPLKTANLPAISPLVKDRINYRVVTASLLILAAIPLMLSSCSKEPSILTSSSSDSSSVATTSRVSATNPIRIFPEDSSISTPKPQASTVAYTRSLNAVRNTTKTFGNESAYYTIGAVEYYQKNHYFADDRITMDDKVAHWIKHPPLRSNPGYYKRYNKVKADFYKARTYRRKLEKLEDKHVGRKSRNLILLDLETKKKKYFEIEAQLFYQLEKIVYYAEQSYYQWQIFKSYNPKQLTKFEKYSIDRSERTADMFQNLSYAVNNYTNSD